jgi:hypothetical protein
MRREAVTVRTSASMLSVNRSIAIAPCLSTNFRPTFCVGSLREGCFQVLAAVHHRDRIHPTN